MKIAIDFDGTIVKHKYPEVGEDIGAFPWMKKFQEAGADLILYTMRDSEELLDAINFCKDNDIEFWAVNDNPNQETWTQSRKIYANAYVDDNAIGCPLICLEDERPYVDWEVVGPMVLEKIREHI